MTDRAGPTGRLRQAEYPASVPLPGISLRHMTAEPALDEKSGRSRPTVPVVTFPQVEGPPQISRQRVTAVSAPQTTCGHPRRPPPGLCLAAVVTPPGARGCDALSAAVGAQQNRCATEPVRGGQGQGVSGGEDP